MKLTPEQVQKLYTFTRQHFVEYYDLQTELVDHLANGIETQWQENKNQSFDEALQKEFKKFGVFGFQDVIEQRHKALNKKYIKIFWQHFKAFFKLPKIILTIAMIGILFQLLKIISHKEVLVFTLIGILAIVLIVKSILLRKESKKRFEQTNKKWMLETYVFGFGNSFLMLNLVIQINSFIINRQDGIFENTNFMIYFSLLFVLFSLFSYVTLFEIPSKVEQYLKENYPEYKMLKKM